MKALTSLLLTCLTLGLSLYTFVFALSFADDRVREPLTIAGPLVSLLGYLSPIPSARAALFSGSTSDLPLPVFVSQLALCGVSAAYGLSISDHPIFVTNIVGLLFQLIWLGVWYYLRWSSVRASKSGIDHPLIILLGSGILLGSCVSLISKVIPSELIGISTVVLSVALSLSPLAQLPRMVRSKRAAALPISMSVMMLLGNILWGVYGWVTSNRVITIPCLLGFEIAIFQLLVTAWCDDALPFELHFLQEMFAYGEGSELIRETTNRLSDYGAAIEEGKRNSSRLVE